jgi:hypothetical protein
LAEYGPEADTARDELRRSIPPLIDRIWRGNISGATETTPFEPTAMGEAAFHKVQELSPRNDAQRALQTGAMQVFTDLAQTSLLLFAQTGDPLPVPFLVVLVFCSPSFSPVSACSLVRTQRSSRLYSSLPC